ncbi:MAG: polysaccharide deacetylase [Lachnospiraceae bacterium]|nr:polysaccharide deacetylase [Lachnospiraceae bacterium]
MVRIKRIRRKKLVLFAAACALCVAVLVLLSVVAVSVIKGIKKADNTGQDNTDTVADIFDGNTEDPGKASPENPGSELPETAEDEPGDAENDVETEEKDMVSSAEVREIPEKREGEKVYITFDDGPSVYTGEILDILREYDAKATFFVCGTGDSDERLKPLYGRIVEEGHTIGMHSYSHVYSKVYGDLELFQYDLDKIRNLIYNETGVVPKYYRFPGGSGNTIASLPMKDYISVLYSQGMEYYDWNVYGGDSSGNRLSSADIVKNTLDGVDRRDTAVILLHDTGSKRNTVEALPGILDGLKQRGMDIRAIDDDTPPFHQFGDMEPDQIN